MQLEAVNHEAEAVAEARAHDAEVGKRTIHFNPITAEVKTHEVHETAEV